MVIIKGKNFNHLSVRAIMAGLLHTEEESFCNTNWILNCVLNAITNAIMMTPLADCIQGPTTSDYSLRITYFLCSNIIMFMVTLRRYYCYAWPLYNRATPSRGNVVSTWTPSTLSLSSLPACHQEDPVRSLPTSLWLCSGWNCKSNSHNRVIGNRSTFWWMIVSHLMLAHLQDLCRSLSYLCTPPQ